MEPQDADICKEGIHMLQESLTKCVTTGGDSAEK